MKKLLALLLALVMVLSFAACSNEPADDTNSDASNETSSTEETPSEPEETAATYTLGMGVVASDASSKDGQAQVNATVAAVVFDAEGKIVKCEFDVAQTKVGFEGGVLPEDLTTVDVRSKQVKKDDYGMRGVSSIGAEWFEQADALAAAIVGMTADEFVGLELVARDESHMVAADETIAASCTMDISDFQAAVAKAAADEYAKEFTAEGEFALGLALDTSVASSKAPADDKDGVAACDTNFTAVVVDANGAILADLLDVLQAKVPFDAAGVVTTGNDLRTKKEKKGDYGMLSASAIGVEWMDQATAFENAIVGMTAADVAGLELVENNGHNVLADETLHASCSMDVTGFQAGLTRAAENAR